MDQHSIKNVNNPVDRLDAVNKAYADRIKYKIATCGIHNTVMTDHTLFTFPTTKAFASGKIKICEKPHQVQCSQLSGLAFTVLKTSVPYDILLWFPASGCTGNFGLDYIELL